MKRIVLILMLLGSLKGRSQELYIPGFASASDSSLDLSSDTVEVYGTIVMNVDTFVNFSGSVNVHIAVKDVLGNPQIMGPPVSIGPQTINALDSVTIPLIKVAIETGLFQDGNNTVVIWPACPGIETYDSLEFLVTFNGIEELIANEIDITMGPNPATDKLVLGDPDNLVKQVRFRTTEGKLVGVASTNAIIDLNLGSGIYIIELETADKKVYTRKLIVRR